MAYWKKMIEDDRGKREDSMDRGDLLSFFGRLLRNLGDDRSVPSMPDHGRRVPGLKERKLRGDFIWKLHLASEVARCSEDDAKAMLHGEMRRIK